jgi:rare lipoprotein A
MKTKLLLSVIFILFVNTSCKEKQEAEYYLFQKGKASWYGPGFHGRKTASGEKFNSDSLTAAHRTLDFGTIVRVTNIENNKFVEVRINDRGPVSKKRIIDLSGAAADSLGIKKKGVGRVTLEIKKTNIHINNEH